MKRGVQPFSGRATSTSLLKEQKSSDSEMMHQRPRLVPMGGGGGREQNLPEGGEKAVETAECFSGIAAFQRKVVYVKGNCELEVWFR